MRLIKSSFEIIEQQSGEVGMLKHIETCGRVAWKSEERITDDSHIKFIDMLKGVNHGSVLEHGTVYLEINNSQNGNFNTLKDKYIGNKYSKVIVKDKPDDLSNRGIVFCEAFITTNYRVLIENNWLDDLKCQCKPTKYHEKRYTVRFVCDRGVSHEFVRHRTFSFTQESTRYCNYTKDKFSNEITFIIPCWIDIKEGTYSYGVARPFKTSTPEEAWADSLIMAEDSYDFLINKGWKPQQARSILPNSLKTELIMTGFVSDWKHFFMLRTAKGAHPQAQELAIPLEQEFKKLNYI